MTTFNCVVEHICILINFNILRETFIMSSSLKEDQTAVLLFNRQVGNPCLYYQKEKKERNEHWVFKIFTLKI